MNAQEYAIEMLGIKGNTTWAHGELSLTFLTEQIEKVWYAACQACHDSEFIVHDPLTETMTSSYNFAPEFNIDSI